MERSSDKRERRIVQAAMRNTLSRGFREREVMEDWLDAFREVDRQSPAGTRGVTATGSAGEDAMQNLSVQEFKTMCDKHGDLTVINVLGEASYRKAHIPETDNVPGDRDDFAERVERLAGGKNRPVVVYCASTQCEASPKAARRLEQAGFERVYDFQGGTKAWIEAGERVVSSEN